MCSIPPGESDSSWDFLELSGSRACFKMKIQMPEECQSHPLKLQSTRATNETLYRYTRRSAALSQRLLIRLREMKGACPYTIRVI